MKLKLLIFVLLLSTPYIINAQSINEKLFGKILLSVEENGEAWYVNPENSRRYYLGRPSDAFEIMRELSLGISNEDFDKYSNTPPERFSGRILLKVEDSGKAYYVNPDDLVFHFLGRPSDAFWVMRNLGLGITKNDLDNIQIYSPTEVFNKNIQHIVAFTSQAPDADWGSSVFQDGCEEASALMAVSWALDDLSQMQNPKNTIVKISAWESERFGEFRDISVEDTTTMIKEYFSYDKIEIHDLKNVEELIALLQEGVVIMPANGQLLGNVYFTPPGPINHMLLVTGYNQEEGIFTTNDPGTKRGKGYRYKKNVLFNSIRDYPTGYHLPNQDPSKKVILVKK